MIRTFGCLCYAHLRSRDKDKFGTRSRKCVLVGYPYGKKGWRLYDIETEKFFTSRDVQFQEDVFPFMNFTENVSTSPSQRVEDIDTDWILPVTTPISLVEASPDTHPTDTLPMEPSISNDATPISPIVSETTESPTPAAVSPPPEVLGRGHRSKKPSVLLKDFVTHHVHSPLTHAFSSGLSDSISSPTASGKILDPIKQCLSDSAFSSNHIAFMAAILDSTEPKYSRDAARITEWCVAMQKEIEA